MTSNGPLGLMEAAETIGHHVWFERRCFEILGSWTAELADGAIKAMVDRHAQHCAWRAGQGWDRLPVLSQVDRDGLVVAPETPAAAMVEALAHLTAPVERVAGAYRVAFPRLADRYRSHLSRTSRLSDGPTIRTMTMLLADLEADWREGEVTLHGLLTSPTETHAAADTVARLETILVDASPAVIRPVRSASVPSGQSDAAPPG
ncbi:MAG: hypothetical protein M3Y91_04915 [Actinomycetota bacterium]|nr:hypothetical protein [Actinomycetota bacterium]